MQSTSFVTKTLEQGMACHLNKIESLQSKDFVQSLADIGLAALRKWLIEWMVFSAKSAIFQQYNGGEKMKNNNNHNEKLTDNRERART